PPLRPRTARSAGLGPPAARLAEDDRGSAASAQCLAERFVEHGELLLSVDQRRMTCSSEKSLARSVSFRSRRGSNLARRDDRPAAGNDLAIDAPCFFGRLDPEFSAEYVHARLILAQRVSETPLLGIQTHQRSVSFFAKGGERQEPDGNLDRGFRGSRLGLMWQEPGEDVDSRFPKTPPFTAKPLLEGLLADVDTVQQISNVKCSGLFEISGSSSRGQPLKLDHVDVDSRLIERHLIALDDQDSRLKGCEGTPERAQALPQALSGLLLHSTAPEHRRELVSRIFLFRSYSEVREQGLSLPCRKRQAALAEPGLKPPEEPKGETRHPAFPESQNLSLGPLR